MAVSIEKAKRLERIARLYYEQDKTQSEIARLERVSRPLISRMLREAKAAGIVEIRIHAAAGGDSLLMNQSKNIFGLDGGILVQNTGEDRDTNRLIAQSTLDLISSLGGGKIGLGWGHIIGVVVETLERKPPRRSIITDVCPMVGNSGISIRNYHSNENTRIIAHHAMATPHYLHTPAFAETRMEMELLAQTEHYKSVMKQWEQLDIALVNIGNHPSTPDFASVARYGDLLVGRQAVGRLIAYYYNQRGEIIHSDTDYAIQIPIPLLARSRHVVGICSANTSWQAMIGALRTGLLTHIVGRDDLMRIALSSL